LLRQGFPDPFRSNLWSNEKNKPSAESTGGEMPEDPTEHRKPIDPLIRVKQEVAMSSY